MNCFRPTIVGLAVLVIVTTSAGLAQPAPPDTQLPPMPVSQSPVEFFRKLIAAPDAEVAKLLANRTPEQRKVIDRKITEYRLLPPPLREWKLKATELRWYLTPLMQLPPRSRGQLLLTVPEADRSLVEARLKQWDSLSATEQQELLNNELALKYVSRPDRAPAPSPAQLTSFPPARRMQLEKAVAQWQSMPDEKRQTLAQRFSGFFNLTSSEQRRTLALFTAGEREALERRINSFADLNPADRERCLSGLRRLSRMSEDERLVFLQGAERWRSLTEDQRDTWRRLVVKLPPSPGSMPPLPPGFKPVPPGPSAAVDSSTIGKTLAALGK